MIAAEHRHFTRRSESGGGNGESPSDSAAAAPIGGDGRSRRLDYHRGRPAAGCRRAPLNIREAGHFGLDRAGPSETAGPSAAGPFGLRIDNPSRPVVPSRSLSTAATPQSGAARRAGGENESSGSPCTDGGPPERTGRSLRLRRLATATGGPGSAACRPVGVCWQARQEAKIRSLAL